MQNANAVLEFIDVCYAYEREEVLHNVSLKIDHGSLVAVVGPNGGGKSTLLKLALGLINPLRGSISLLGGNPAKNRQKVGYVPQHLFFDHLFPVSAMDVILMGRVERHICSWYSKADRIAAEQSLERVGMSGLGSRGFSMLSGGERQRVLIAQALCSEPEMLLLDEPTANVDSVVEHEIYQLLAELNKQISIVVVSHNLNVVTRHATHVACVNRTTSLIDIAEFNEDKVHAIYRGDMAVLQHKQCCHVIDPSDVMKSPHRAAISTREGK